TYDVVKKFLSQSFSSSLYVSYFQLPSVDCFSHIRPVFSLDYKRSFLERLSIIIWFRIRVYIWHDPKRGAFDNIEQFFFNHDSETFKRLELDGIFFGKNLLSSHTFGQQRKLSICLQWST